MLIACTGCSKIAEQRKESYYARGKQLYEAGEYNKALREFKNALAFDAGFFDALYLSGMCWYQRKVYNEAWPWFAKAFSARNDDLELCILLVESLLGANRLGMAIKYSSDGLALDPGNSRLLYLDTKVRIRGRNERSIRIATERIELLLEEGHQDSGLLLLLAEIMILQGRQDRAAVLLDRPDLKTHPDWVDVMLFFADRLKRDRDDDRYVEVYTSIMEQAEDRAPHMRQLVLFFRAIGDARREEQTLRDLLALENSAGTKKALIDFFMRSNRFTEAREMIVAELENDPASQQLAVMLVNLYLLQGENAAAIEFLRKRLESGAGTAEEGLELMVLLAEAHLRDNNHTVAENIARAVLRERPGNIPALFVVSKIRLQRGEYLAAVGDFRRLAALNPENPEFNFYLGMAHLGLQEKLMARKAFEDVLDLSPAYKPALLQLAQIYMAEGSYMELKRRMEIYLERNPHDLEIAEMLNALP